MKAVDEIVLKRSVRVLCRAEPRFAGIVERHGLPPLWPREPGFATLALLMLEQQVSLAQARAMYARIEMTGGVTVPNVTRLGEPGLRALGITRQKSAYLAALADQLLAGEVDLRRLSTWEDEEALAALDALHGVGPWTAHCYLLFALRRPDAFPASDLGLLEAVRELLEIE